MRHSQHSIISKNLRRRFPIAKTDTTFQLEKAIIRETSKLGTFGCLEVTIGFGGNERVDYMTVDTKGVWRCYEIKCSVSDFRSKAKKTFVGHYNYFVMTSDVYEKVKDEVPSHIGVYIMGRLVKRPKRQELAVDESVLKWSMIRSLCRESDKYRKAKNKDYVERLEGENSRYKNEIRNLKKELSEARNKLWRNP